MGRKQGKQAITPAELKILGLIQSHGPLTIRSLYKLADPQESGAYTTTLKTAQNMFEKGLLNRDTSERSHIYSIAPAAEVAQSKLFANMLSNIFDGSLSKMLLNVVDTENVTSDELTELENTVRLLKEAQRKNGGTQH